jgi:hypothetical protein
MKASEFLNESQGLPRDLQWLLQFGILEQGSFRRIAIGRPYIRACMRTAEVEGSNPSRPTTHVVTPVARAGDADDRFIHQ